jgi:hypothetical protein
LDCVEAKFANNELNSLARSAIEGVLALLPLLDCVIVVNGVGKVVGDRLTVMDPSSRAIVRSRQGKQRANIKNLDISVKNQFFRLLVWANASLWSQHVGNICRESCRPERQKTPLRGTALFDSARELITDR